MKETEKCLDSHLWHACAGSMVQMPPVNSKVFYFPQGHLEHACGNVDIGNYPSFPSYVPCKVSAVKFMADPETDEVFVKIRLVPIAGNEVDFDNDGAIGLKGTENQDKPTSFAKTLTQSDANNGGGFSVPRGTPRRHLLTTGWSNFVNHKKLVAGDSIVFLRAENGDICVGIRRAKRGIGGGPEMSLGWSQIGGNGIVSYGGFQALLSKDENKLTRNSNENEGGSLISRGQAKTEHVIEAASLAANGQPFDVIYYPRASTPEFCVKASLVKAAMQIHWCSGMRFKMAFETEDSSRISWFMGTILSVQVIDPIRWPNSPWRLLQVRWDEPDLLQNVKRVSPWLVELVSNVPTIHLSPFSPPHKKLRLQQHPDFPLDGQFTSPAFCGDYHFPRSGNPFGCLVDNTPAGMQGARHARYGLSSSHLNLIKLQSGLFPVGFLPRDGAPISSGGPNSVALKAGSDENTSCLLTMGISAHGSREKSDSEKSTPFLLFGQPILVKKQSSSSDTVSTIRTENNSSNCNADRIGNTSDRSGSTLHRSGAPEHSSCEVFQSELSLEIDHCKVFVESEDVGRTLDLSLLGSYEELHRKLTDMFGNEISETPNHVHYRDTSGVVRQLGEEPFSNFMKRARRLTIVADSSSDNVGA
ncbi:UNVERIFIED_CONTAM: Auxin response factor 18 [Sesamum radiatum]|uniref:Auxin response factor n=1 Tax=Sesamum radiatum TaxID=300843 RepID=A0AAW2NQ19_SESRA